jgi:hypothetical protein
MNERIKELAEQAREFATTRHPVSNITLSVNSDLFEEKFAELIVRECVKFCEHESNDDEHDEYDMGMWVKAESIKTSIKQHFGVEE